MSDPDVIDELDHALRHVAQAKDLTEGSTLEVELQNLERMWTDVRDWARNDARGDE